MRWSAVFAASLLAAFSARAQNASQISFLYVRDQVNATFEALDGGGDFGAAARRLGALFDQCVAYAPVPDADNAMGRADWAYRLVWQLERAPQASRRTLWPFLRQHSRVAHEVAFAIGPRDDAGAAYVVLDKLRQAFGEEIEKHATLAAAVCVVYDRPRPAGVSHAAKDRTFIDPVGVFGHFSSNYDRLALKLDDLPPRVLVYLVDTQAGPGELSWALTRFAGDADIAKRYAEVPKDTGVYRFQNPRKIMRMPYTLENIVRTGGIPEDNAYYAAHVAKALGIPAVVIAGRSGSLAHARVGVLRSQDRQWNLDIGRINDFENAQGELTDPQTGELITDSDLALAAGCLNEQAPDTIASDVLRRIVELDAQGSYPPPPLPVTDALPSARPAGAEARLAWARRQVESWPFRPDSWNAIRDVYKAMSADDRRAFTEGLMGPVPFAHHHFRVLVEVMGAETDPVRRARTWEQAAHELASVPDLAADARFRLARAWMESGDSLKAYLGYVDLAKDLPEQGPYAYDAMVQAEQLLRDAGKESQVAPLYESVWKQLVAPTDPQKFDGSSFNRIGGKYAAALDACHERDLAKDVRRAIEDARKTATAPP